MRCELTPPQFIRNVFVPKKKLRWQRHIRAPATRTSRLVWLEFSHRQTTEATATAEEEKTTNEQIVWHPNEDTHTKLAHNCDFIFRCAHTKNEINDIRVPLIIMPKLKWRRSTVQTKRGTVDVLWMCHRLSRLCLGLMCSVCSLFTFDINYNEWPNKIELKSEESESKWIVLSN